MSYRSFRNRNSRTTVDVGKGTFLEVRSPYHPALANQARALGGRWRESQLPQDLGCGGMWVFDLRDYVRVRDLYMGLFGAFGPVPAEELVDIEIDVVDLVEESFEGGSYWYEPAQLFVCGRLAAERRRSVWGVELGEKVIIARGEFAPRAGDIRTPGLAPSADAQLIMRDVPRCIAERAAAETPAVRIHADTVRSETAVDILRNALRAAGYDGLCEPDCECGCELDDLIPCCGAWWGDCLPAYRRDDGESGFFMVAADSEAAKAEKER